MSAASQVPLRDDHSGPYNVTILEGGEGLTRKLEPGTASLDANGAWSMTGWVNPRREQRSNVLLLSVGSSQQDGRALMLNNGEFALWVGSRVLRSGTTVKPGTWTALAATFDGSRARLFADGREVAAEDMSVGATSARRCFPASRAPSSNIPPRSEMPRRSACAAGTSSRRPCVPQTGWRLRRPIYNPDSNPW